MKVYDENAGTLGQVFDRLEERVEALPPHLRGQGRAFLTWAGRGYFTQPDAAPLMHLPLWMPQAVAPEVQLDLLEATALAYAYVRIQDNVIDEPGTRGHPPLLLLGNVFLWDALALWRRHTDARFEGLAREAWVVFSEFTEAERAQLQRRDGYSAHAFARHAQKCAMAELPLYAVMSVAGDWTAVDEVAPLVHGLASSYGCVNDVLGWERDLASGGNTYLLARARALVGADAPPDEVARALVGSPLMEEMLLAAESHLASCQEPARRLGLRRFDAFHHARRLRLQDIQARVSVLRLANLLAS